MISVAVIGAKGFVGGHLCAAFSLDARYSLTPVTRAEYESARSGSYDVLVNAAMPSKRFWARTHPDKDFAETVGGTAELLYRWRFKKFVQVSTVSARCQLDTVYGRHKAAAEKLCGFGENLIVRLGPLYGSGLQRGVLIDMLEGRKVFADGDSRYCFAPVGFAASWIVRNLHRSGIAEVGARNALALRDAAAHLGRKIEFEGAVDHQEIPSPPGDFPDARDALVFLDEKRRERRAGAAE